METALKRYEVARRRMVLEQLTARNITDKRVLDAMLKVPREAFVPVGLRDQAYSDHPLNIGEGQTISQPFIVALMTQALALTGTEKVLEIGTGSGYQTAILLELVNSLYSVERIARISHRARKTLYSLGYDHFKLRIGDGSLGWSEEAPFDAIIVTAGSPIRPQSLVEQLAEGGRLVIPEGSAESQDLMFYQRDGGQIQTKNLGPCRFVPLIGDQGWNEGRR